MAFRMFVHALKMVFTDLGAVVKVSMPLIIVIALGVVFLGTEMQMMSAVTDDPFAEPSMEDLQAFSGGLLLFLLGYMVATLWMAVAWHRYCLLNEYPSGLIPAFNGSRILAYFGRILLLIVLGVAAMLAGSLVIGLFAAAGGGAGSVVASLIGVVGFLFLFFALYRLSIILPAAAIGEDLRFGAAWAATAPYALTILGLVVLLFLFSIAVGLVAGLFLFIPFVGTVIQVLVNWLLTVLGLSILTTIYGVAVQDRTIE